jgi:hypothetical protein
MSIPHFLLQQSACHVEMSEYDSAKLSALSTVQFKLREIKYSIQNHTGEKKGMQYLENPKHLNWYRCFD